MATNQKRIDALIAAVQVLPEDSLISDLLEAANFILGQEEPADLSIGDRVVIVQAKFVEQYIGMIGHLEEILIVGERIGNVPHRYRVRLDGTTRTTLYASEVEKI